jgi:hypothetical protein
MLQRRFTITTILAAALAVAALAAPSAIARLDLPIGPPSSSTALSEQERQVLASRGVGAPTPRVEFIRVPGPTVRVEADGSSGFDWGSAGIGGGVVAAIVLLAGAAASPTVRRHRVA